MTIDAPAFHGNPEMTSLFGRHEYVLDQKPDKWFGYETKDGIWLVPHNGLHTDQGSIPQIFWCLIPSDAYWAFYIHDDLYQFGGYRVFDLDGAGLPDLTLQLGFVKVTRDQADKWLWEMMRSENRLGSGNAFKSWVIYRKVRRWGFIPWNKHNDGRIPSSFHLV